MPMNQITYKKFVAAAVLGLLGCYGLLLLPTWIHPPKFEQAQTNTVTGRGYRSNVLKWSSNRITENLVSKILRPIVNNPAWHGKSMLVNHSSLLTFTESDDLQLLAKNIASGGLNISSLAEYSIQTLPADSIELRLLRDPPLKDPLDAANESTSRVTILGSAGEYSVTDRVQLRVDVYNGRGHALLRGGDQVRVWGLDVAQQASLATEVTDLGNGSYLASLPLLWPGDVQVKVALTYNREILRAISYVKAATRTTKFIAAGFFSDSSNEATLCATYPFVPGGYKEICNLTESNGGMPWFCGKPRNPALSCNHWKYVSDLEFVDPLPVTSAEYVWINWLDVPKNLRLVKQFTFQNKPTAIQSGFPLIQVKPVPPKPNEQTKQSCAERNLEDTWTDTAPRGYWMKQVWNPLACTAPVFDRSRASSCLKDTTVLLLGDSNLRLAMAILKDLTGCVLDTGGEVMPKWHHQLRCTTNKANIEVIWRPHGHPFHTGKGWGERVDLKAANEYIDEIPNNGKFLVIVHLYLHFTVELVENFHTHVRAVRAAVERLLVRNPHAKVVIRAPHAASQFWPTIHSSCDAFAWAFTDILKAEFAGLRDKVVFIQLWDMTVAEENVLSHPLDYINRAIMNQILAHVC